MTTDLKIVPNATCTFCGCVCDDMELTVEGNKITKDKNACVRGLRQLQAGRWFHGNMLQEALGLRIMGLDCQRFL